MGQDAVGRYMSHIGEWQLLTPDEEKLCSRALQKYLKLKKELLNSPNCPADGSQSVGIEEKHLYYLNEKCCFAAWKRNIKGNIFSIWSVVVGVEIEELFSIFWQGIKSKKRLYTGNLRLVISIAKKYITYGIEFEDAIQEGNRGLNSAVDKFSSDYNCRFSTYAYWWIKQMITRSICDTARSVRLPVHVTDRKCKILREIRDFFIREGRYPTSSEVEKKMELEEGKISEIFSNCMPVVPLDSKIGKEKESSLWEVVGEQWKPNYSELEDGVMNGLSLLTEGQRQVLIIRYGLSGDTPKSLAVTGLEMGVNKAVVRRIEIAAFNKLRKLKDLRDCLG